jgi:hypothetical protein
MVKMGIFSQTANPYGVRVSGRWENGVFGIINAIYISDPGEILSPSSESVTLRGEEGETNMRNEFTENQGYEIISLMEEIDALLSLFEDKGVEDMVAYQVTDDEIEFLLREWEVGRIQ